MINWTKKWAPSDDGTLLRGIDLRNMQDDIAAGAVSVNNSPTSGDVLYWDGSGWNSRSVAIDYVFSDDEVCSWENDIVINA